MSKIRLSPDVTLPVDAVTQTFAVLGKRGSGKTNTASVLFEQLVKSGQPAVYVDPIGVTWGLRHSRDGKGPGLSVIILGGEHADVPLEEGGGVVIADFVIEHRQPVVVDLGLLSKSAQRRFMVDFTERLYHKNRSALHVMLDECDTFVPQRIDHGGERLVGAVNDLVRKGRARGLGVTLISQRPALVNKDVLTQVETLVAHRMTGPHDRDAIERWIECNASGGDDVLVSLQLLEDGEAWVWSPSWLKTLVRTKINLRETFDSSATPKAGARAAAPKHAAEVDLASLRAQLAATIERAKADDPRELKRRIAELEKQLKSQKLAPAEVRVVEKPVLTQKQVDDLAMAASKMDLLGAQLSNASLDVGRVLRAFEDSRRATRSMQDVSRVAPSVRSVPTLPAARPKPTAPADESNGELPKGERAVLTAAAQYQDGADRNQISILTGYKRQTRDDYISRLSRRGFVVAPPGGKVRATEEGVAAIGPSFEPLPTGAALIEHWKDKLPRGERAIFEVLVAEWPNAVPRDVIGEVTGFKRQTRDDYISRMARRKIIDKPVVGQPIRVSAAMMEE